MTRAALPCLAIVLLAFPAAAQSNNSNYVFLLASGFLCEPGDTSTCPATAKGNQGDSYEMSGVGTFDSQSKSAKAAGTYTHKSPHAYPVVSASHNMLWSVLAGWLGTVRLVRISL
jgi:hypothetical protein